MTECCCCKKAATYRYWTVVRDNTAALCEDCAAVAENLLATLKINYGCVEIMRAPSGPPPRSDCDYGPDDPPMSPLGVDLMA